MQLNDNIKLIRELSGVKQEDFAKLIKTNLSNLKTYENTDTKAKAPVLAAIADIAGITVDELEKKKLTHKDVTITLPEEDEQDEKDGKVENTPVDSLRANGTPDSKDELISLMREIIELRRKPAGKEINLAELSRELMVTAQMLSAAMEILIVIAEADPKKAVYNKTVEILRKHKLEGSFL